jgi:hypothetical protein
MSFLSDTAERDEVQRTPLVAPRIVPGASVGRR